MGAMDNQKAISPDGTMTAAIQGQKIVVTQVKTCAIIKMKLISYYRQYGLKLAIKRIFDFIGR